GIRGPLVTGVQTCALPIFRSRPGLRPVVNKVLHRGRWALLHWRQMRGHRVTLGVVGRLRGVIVIASEPLFVHPTHVVDAPLFVRSEERRVGTGCGGPWSQE